MHLELRKGLSKMPHINHNPIPTSQDFQERPREQGQMRTPQVEKADRPEMARTHHHDPREQERDRMSASNRSNKTPARINSFSPGHCPRNQKTRGCKRTHGINMAWNRMKMARPSEII